MVPAAHVCVSDKIMSKLLAEVSKNIASDWKFFGIELDLSSAELDQLANNHAQNIGNRVLDMLQTWNARSTLRHDEKIVKLKEALEAIGRVDVSGLVDAKTAGSVLHSSFQLCLYVSTFHS